jgi:hypothetical protein
VAREAGRGWRPRGLTGGVERGAAGVGVGHGVAASGAVAVGCTRGTAAVSTPAAPDDAPGAGAAALPVGVRARVPGPVAAGPVVAVGSAAAVGPAAGARRHRGAL